MRLSGIDSLSRGSDGPIQRKTEVRSYHKRSGYQRYIGTLQIHAETEGNISLSFSCFNRHRAFVSFDEYSRRHPVYEGRFRAVRVIFFQK